MKFFVVIKILLSISLYGQPHWVFANDDADNPRPNVAHGAQVYNYYCTLCHGPTGMGDGALPQRIADYPNTGLHLAGKTNSHQEILDAIVYGGTHTKYSQYMPPFGNELAWSQVESVALFISYLRQDREGAIRLLSKVDSIGIASIKTGRRTYTHRCVLCHGEYGEGDGRMAKILKDPPPANLVTSKVPEDYLKKIIADGGEGVGRSKHMPPWRDELTDTELQSIILYLLSIRES